MKTREINLTNLKEASISIGYGKDDILRLTAETNQLDRPMELNYAKNIRLVYEIESEILDKEEKDFLSHLLIERNEISFILKCDNAFNDYEHIKIIYKDNDYTSLKNFKKGTMYKNMETNVRYTLKELGL